MRPIVRPVHNNWDSAVTLNVQSATCVLPVPSGQFVAQLARVRNRHTLTSLVHRANTFSGQRLAAHLEADWVLDRFFQGIESHPVLRDPVSRQGFLDEVRRRALTAFLPPALRAAVSSPTG